MTEIIELSSSDEEVCYKTNKINSDSDTTVNTEIENILHKYKSVSDKLNSSPKKENISSSDDDDEYDINNLRSLREKLELKYNLPSCSKNTNFFNEEPKDNISQTTTNSQNSETIEILEPTKPKKRRPTNTEDKNCKRIEKEQEKARKQSEREQKRAENAAAKAQKLALASAYENLKPDECIRFITTFIDTDLMSTECGTDIPNILQTSSINYKIDSNIQPFTITWKMKNQSQLTNIDGQLKLTANENQCEQVLLIILWQEFVKLVHENKINDHFKSLYSILLGKKIFLGIYGIENYFKAHKSQKQKTSARDKIYLASPIISRKDVDMSLIELQLVYGISHRFLETPQEVSAMVLQFTKSIAQIPYKLQKQQKEEQMDWFVSGDNKDCVRVDKNGNGLYRLWQQQITQLNLARLEIAEAVTSKYPSPANLMKAYDECATKEQKEKLLQDIPIRRAVGPLTCLRKIGPEFSKKMHILFTSLDPSIQL